MVLGMTGKYTADFHFWGRYVNYAHAEANMIAD